MGIQHTTSQREVEHGFFIYYLACWNNDAFFGSNKNIIYFWLIQESPAQPSFMGHFYLEDTCHGTVGVPWIEVPLQYPYTFYWKKMPLSENFYCCKCTVVKIWIYHKTRTFSWLFYSNKMHLLALSGLFMTEWQISPPLHVVQKVKYLSSRYIWRLK